MRKQVLTRIGRLFACVALVGAAVLLDRLVMPVNATTAALTLLLVVLSVATFWGLWDSIATSLAAVLAFNYFFLPPIGTLTIDDPQNWVALVTFLVVAITASQLSSRAKGRATEASLRRAETERLYELGRAILINDQFGKSAAKTLEDIVRIFQLNGVALFDLAENSSQRVGSLGPELADTVLGEAAKNGGAAVELRHGQRVVPIQLGTRNLGALGLDAEAPLSTTIAEAIANLVGISMERARAMTLAASAEASRRSEELKSILLDRLAHDLKTPLTGIKAAITSLITNPPRTDASRDELLSIVDEETDRLHRTVSEAIQMARIDARKLRLERDDWSLEEIAGKALHELRQERSAIEWEVPPQFPLLHVDGDLLADVLKQLFDNALRYAGSGERPALRASVENDVATVSVSDAGPGLDSGEQRKIFDKFYRGAQATQSAGTGMGLAIAKGIVEAHGGKIWAQNGPHGGAVFTLQIPIAGSEVPLASAST